MKRALCTSALTGVLALGGAVACDNVAAPGMEPVSLTFAVARSTALGAGGVAALAASDVTADDGIRCATLSAVDVRLSKIDFERADAFDDEDTDRDTDNGADSDRDTDTDGRDNVRLKGPITIALPLAAPWTVAIQERLPFGTFDEIEFRVDRIHLVGLLGQRVNGLCVTSAGDAFDVTVPIHEKFEIELDEPLVIDANTVNPNVTIVIDPAAWLVIDGRVIDPRRLESDKRLRQRFRARIRAAIRAFEDANRNGEDDRDTDADHHR